MQTISTQTLVLKINHTAAQYTSSCLGKSAGQSIRVLNSSDHGFIGFGVRYFIQKTLASAALWAAQISVAREGTGRCYGGICGDTMVKIKIMLPDIPISADGYLGSTFCK